MAGAVSFCPRVTDASLQSAAGARYTSPMTRSAKSPALGLPAAVLCAALGALLLTPADAQAEATAPPESSELTQAAREAIEKFAAVIGPMLDSFEQWIADMPRYEAPEILPNGDILIRRIPKDAPPPSDAAPGSPGSDVTNL